MFHKPHAMFDATILKNTVCNSESSNMFNLI